MKVLLTDDSAFMRAIVKNALKSVPDISFMEAENGDVAVELYRNNQFDAVFLDIIMPVKNGIMAMEEIRQMNKNAKIIIVTSVSQEEMIEKARSLGANAFLAKPFQPQQIKDLFDKVMAGEIIEITTPTQAPLNVAEITQVPTAPVAPVAPVIPAAPVQPPISAPAAEAAPAVAAPATIEEAPVPVLHPPILGVNLDQDPAQESAAVADAVLPSAAPVNQESQDVEVTQQTSSAPAEESKTPARTAGASAHSVHTGILFS